jgi:hypothetical protein
MPLDVTPFGNPMRGNIIQVHDVHGTKGSKGGYSDIGCEQGANELDSRFRLGLFAFQR